MSSRLSFYAIVAVLIGLLGWAGYRLFVSEEAEKIADRMSRPTSKDYQENTRSGSSSNNVWMNEKLRETLESSDARDLKASAEVQNHIQNLTDLYNRGEDDTLLPLALDLFEKNPEVKEYSAFLGDYYFNEGNWAEAEKYVKRLTELDPANTFARTTLGEVYATQGRYDEGLQSMEEVLQRDPNNLQALYGVSSIHDMKGQPEQGSRRIEELYRANPSSGNVATVYADTLLAEGKTSDAHRILDQAIQNDAQNPAPLIRKGEILFGEGRDAEALSALDNAAMRASTVDEKLIIYRKSARMAVDIGNLTKAEAIRDQVAQLKPASVELRDIQREIEGLKQQPKNKKG